MEFGSFREYLFMLARDKRLTVWHISVLFAIMQLCQQDDVFGTTIFISRAKVMRLALIKSAMTYHKCMAQLQQYGYVLYLPSYHPEVGSRVFLLAN